MPARDHRSAVRIPEKSRRKAPSRCIFWPVLSSAWRSIRQQHIDPPEPRRRAAMTDGINLARLAFAVIRRAPLHPITRAGDPVAGLPQVGRAGLIGDARKHPLLLAAFDGPKGIASELEIVTLMIDRP